MDRLQIWRIASLGFSIMPSIAAADGYGFMTPSGNIYCNGAVQVSEISCTIVERSSSPAQPRPGSCTGSWGHSFSLKATGPATPLCDRVPPKRVSYTDIAPYGVSAELGDITCRSERNGLSCRNRSGHGFSLSRDRQELF